MRFVISIETDNEAFESPAQLSALLREIAHRIDNGEAAGSLRDRNGNTVGAFGYSAEREVV